MGWLAPVGVSSPDGRFVAYSAWTDLVTIQPQKSWSEQGIRPGDPVGTPSIRLVDRRTGEDSLFETGAFSFAWRSDGAVAYFEGDMEHFRVDQAYPGTIRVRDSLQAAPVAWTSEHAQYVVIAWAGNSLLAYRQSEGEWLDLLALDGPDSIRLLAAGANLVAVSPDGERVLVSQGEWAGVLEVASGEQLASLDLKSTADPVTGAPIRYLAYGGSWIGDRIAAEGGPGIVILESRGASLRVTGAVALPEKDFPLPPHEPELLGSSGARVVAWIPVMRGGDRQYAYLDCELATLHCVAGPLRDDQVFFSVRNPSRPLVGVSAS